MNKKVETIETRFGKFEIEETDSLNFNLRSGSFTDSKSYRASHNGKVFANGYPSRKKLVDDLDTANSFAIRHFFKLNSGK